MLKKQQQRGKNNLYKPLWAIFLVVAILCIAPVLAEELTTLDNIKQYDEDTKTVTIVNAFNLPTARDIATIQLNTPLYNEVAVGSNIKVAEFELNLFDNTYSNAFKDMNFYDLKDDEKKIEREFIYKYKTIKSFEINDYGNVCTFLKNNTKVCTYEIVGTHQEEREVWEVLDTSVLTKGKITIGIFTEVKNADYIEWIPTLFGKKINEWATFSATGGTISYYEDGGLNYTIHTFTTNGTFTVTGSGNVEVLVIAGGGGGSGGGGGAGGYIYNTSFPVTTQAYPIIVGFGGDGTDDTFNNNGDSGQDSSFSTLIAVGGGGGGYANNNGVNGGSGGGGSGWDSGHTFGGTETEGQGKYGGGNGNIQAAPYPSGGGGGAGTVGINATAIVAGNGGNGLSNGINGTNITRAGGGGGGINANTAGVGGSGGGGDGAVAGVGSSAINNTGSGGGGSELDGGVDGGMGGSGIIIIRYLELTESSPTVILNDPEQYENFSNAEMVFDTDVYTYSEDLIIQNVSLILDGELNDTITNGVNGTYQFVDAIVSEGKHNWSILAYGNNSESTQSSTREFWVDITNPVITITSPLNNSVIVSTTAVYNVSFNAAITDLNLDSCWYNNGTANITVTCGNNATINLSAGFNTLIWYANDTFGNDAFNSTTFFINYIQDSLDFTDPIIEGQNDLIVFNVTATNIDSLTAILEYNNTNYTMEGSSNSTYGELEYTITAPTVAANTEIPLRVYYTLNDLNYTSSDYNQTVYFITPMEVAETCSAGLSPAMFFNFTHAQNLTQIINGSIDYNFKMGITDTTEKVTTGTLDNINWFYLCINSTVYNNYTLGYGEIDYSKTGYSDRRWYAFNNQRLSNTTINNSLYFLPTGSSTSFLITIQQPTLTPYQNVYTSLLRWYPAIDDYKIVEMGKTDDKGQTVKKIEVEDIDYRIGVYEQDGTLIYLASPIRMVCIASPCSYTLTVTSTTGVSYTNFLGVVGTLVYDEGVFLYTYNDPSQTTSTIYLNVSRVSGNNEALLCQDTSTSFTGILTCNVTGEQGLLKGIVYRSASPERALDILWIDNLNTIFQSTTGLFFVMIIVLALFLIGIYYPIASILLGLLALIPALFLKVITYPILIGIAVLAGIVIHFMRETTR